MFLPFCLLFRPPFEDIFSEAKAGGRAHDEQERQKHGGALAHPAPLGVLWYGEYLVASIVFYKYHEHDGE